ncbi:hypothetical protein PDK44_27630, partial [Bacillus cereus]|nr:hypothetical protein [Bacillus cereus]
LGTRFIQVVPEVQIHTAQDNHDGVLRVGDTQGRLRSWFAQHNASLVVMRPDRFVAATAIPQTLGKTLNKLASVMTLTRPDADVSVEKVALYARLSSLSFPLAAGGVCRPGARGAR